MPDDPARAQTAREPRCLCCGQPCGYGTYADLPCCWNCYFTGDLLCCLDDDGNWNAPPAPVAGREEGDCGSADD